MQKDLNWWEDLYDELLADVMLENQSEEQINQTVVFLSKVFNFKSGDILFDQCCGIGNLAVSLAKKELKIVGVDIGQNYIQRALAKAKENNVNLDLYSDDAFNFKTPYQCDFAINWWTGFGYKEKDSENIEMIKRVYESLKVGGLFLLDFMNVPQVFRDFKESVVIETDTKYGKVKLERVSYLELDKGFIYKDWIYTFKDGSKKILKSRVKLYLPNQLKDLFESVGFKNIKFYGNINLENLTLSSPRCIVLGEK
jgi:ubiquinone/menaquinone biosynthesis C-methylase UbiE